MPPTAAKRCPICSKEFAVAQTFCPDDGALLDAIVPPEPAPGAVVAGHKILKKLGEGGMGQVYLAEHVRIGRKVALKVMRPDVASEQNAVDRFVREARNASVLNHPNVATVYEFGETSDGSLFLAMEFVDGAPLSKILHDQGAMPARRAVHILKQAADALKAAHDLGMVHRDLKPDNIMVARAPDGGDRAKLVDFGISKVAGAADQRVTTTGLTVGTPAYMSPEQVAGGDVHGASDQFSLACTAFEMVTGALPFEGDTGLDQVASRLTGKARKLTQVRSDVPWPAGLQEVFEKALSQRPAERYANVIEFAAAFEKAAAAMPAASEQATMMMVAPTIVEGTIPPTMVRAAADAVSDTPVAASKPAASVATPPVASTPTKSRTPMLMAAGVALAVVAGGGYFMTRGGGAPSTTVASNESGALPKGAPLAQDARPLGGDAGVQQMSKPTEVALPPTGGAATPPANTAAAGSTGNNAPPAASSPAPSAQPTRTTPAPAAQPSAAPAAAPANAGRASFSADRDRLEKLAGSSAPADLNSAVTLSGQLLDRASSANDSVGVLYEGARALGGLGKATQSCAVFRRALKIAGSLPSASLVKEAMQDAGC